MLTKVCDVIAHTDENKVVVHPASQDGHSMSHHVWEVRLSQHLPRAEYGRERKR
jgi:hypothetical protein